MAAGKRLLDHRETLAREGEKFYQILTATGGEKEDYTPGELLLGRQHPGEASPHRLAYLEDQIRRRRRALAGMARSAHPDPAALAREEALAADLERMREEWTAWQR